jgi:hypothetical protein
MVQARTFNKDRAENLVYQAWPQLLGYQKEQNRNMKK